MELGIKVAATMSMTLLSASISMGLFGIYKQTTNYAMQSNMSFYSEMPLSANDLLIGKQYPVIEVENQRIKLNDTFDPKEWVKVIDEQDGDISSLVNVYGAVDNTQKGEYEIRYSIRNSIGLKTSKKIKVIVD